MIILIFKFKRGAIVNYQADVNYLKRACDTKSPCVGRCGATSSFSARLPNILENKYVLHLIDIK